MFSKKKLPIPMLALATLAVAAVAATAAGPPVTVSPGSPDRLLEVSAACPTFSWVAGQAAAAELRVYRVGEDGELALPAATAAGIDSGERPEAELVLWVRPPRGATSWTPPARDCLEPGGRYAWLVGGGGEDGSWSEALMFEVAMPAQSELERAVERVLAKFVREGRLAPEGLMAVRALVPGVEAVEAAAAPPEDDRSSAAAAGGGPPQATTSGQAAFVADEPTTTGIVTFGVKGVSHSDTADSAGVLGYSDAISGKTYGVLGVTDASSGRAVEGFASSLFGTTYGLSGIASSNSGRGVRGIATAISGATRGVEGTAFSTSGVGGLFQNIAGGPDLELGGSGRILVGSGLFQLDFGGGGVFSVAASGDVTTTGEVTATAFRGDGSALTGLAEINTGSIENESILSEDIKDGEVKNSDLGADAVGSAEIADGSVGSAEIADGSVAVGDLEFLPATQVELDGHAGLADAHREHASLEESEEIDADIVTHSGTTAAHHAPTVDTDTFVTNKDAHDHLGGDGAAVLHSSLGAVGASDHHARYTDADALAAVGPGSTSLGSLALCDGVPGGWRWWDLGDGTVLDCNTRKIWLKDASCLGSWPYEDGANPNIFDQVDALNTGTNFNCAEYTPGAYTDWEVPAMSSMCGLWNGSCIGTLCCTASQGIVDTSVSGPPTVANGKGDATWTPGNAFVGVQSSFYWSATEADATNAWLVNLYGGTVSPNSKVSSLYVWPVRSGQ